MNDLVGVVTFLFTEHIPMLSASVVLLVLSATFSSCETSLFSLSAPELNQVRAGKRAGDRVIDQLHSHLKTLLPTLLFCNMAVNVLIFSIAASMASDLGGRFGAATAFAYSLASLFLVVFFGEVFPKQFAISSSLTVARVTSFPVWAIYKAIGRPMRVLNSLVGAMERVFDYRRADQRGVREEELRLLVEMSRNDGVISDGEYTMIDSIVDLPSVKVHEIMIPRIDVACLPFGAGLEEIMEEARRSRHCKLPVWDAGGDDLAGWVDARDVYADHPGAQTRAAETVESYLREFRYFSEHDRADQVLERIKGEGGDLFAAVDERGTIVGFFTLQDIMDEVLGHFGEYGAAPAPDIREVRGGYIISGRLSVREWRDLFDVSSAMPKSTTVGGLVVALLGRIPKPGDRIELDNMEMTVLSTWHNRVTEVGLRLIHPADREKAEKKVSARFSM